MKVLDHGYVKLIETWGSDERIIESARMSTSKPFEGWGPRGKCLKCAMDLTSWRSSTVGGLPLYIHETTCGGEVIVTAGDEKLLAFLWKNKHYTPFEMAGATFEIEAPLMVFREWHRHRTQGYSEMSARYVPLPNTNYMPTLERIKNGVALAKGNRQAQGAVELNESLAYAWLEHLQLVYDHAQNVYEMGINAGVPKELARLCVPVARYSRMRATANLRNWLGFLALRDSQHAPGAQWEIRQFADAVGLLLGQSFPRTLTLFNQEK
jgi:thymidylate synthase (FAD)